MRHYWTPLFQNKTASKIRKSQRVNSGLAYHALQESHGCLGFLQNLTVQAFVFCLDLGKTYTFITLHRLLISTYLHMGFCKKTHQVGPGTHEKSPPTWGGRGSSAITVKSYSMIMWQNPKSLIYLPVLSDVTPCKQISARSSTSW